MMGVDEARDLLRNGLGLPRNDEYQVHNSTLWDGPVNTRTDPASHMKPINLQATVESRQSVHFSPIPASTSIPVHFTFGH